ncbi:hypothetical protein [Rhizobium laguerreae]|uniref:hypothetical protein n=1 Tax=Rhizobium laguerreae TaxID=1076926 RepID=UPI001C927C30|nr:hypothetical protein [Rhizobium laguerreae]MBY3434877.1 hypothetical protein [Rhizobium laguerreae]MBY3449019.1 hypothetical protein [Rhizobium laguerreae]MBY3456793.1 hypothetical protein [Rhizobium laguerreae]
MSGRPDRVMTDDKFARGLANGLALSLLLWGMMALAVVSLAGCETYQPPAGGLEGGVREVLR